MNKQRKVLITITYNEMGIIIDTKAEEVTRARDIDAPIKRGRWIPCGIGWICSQCRGYDTFAKCREFKEGVPYSEMPFTLLRDRFCPFCGAKMEEQNENLDE